MKKSNKVLLISIAVVLCVGIIAAVWCSIGKNPDTYGTDDTATSSTPTNGEQLGDGDTSKNDGNETKYTVAFFDSAGYLLKEEQVEEHKGAEPPENFIPDADKLFVGWDKDFSYIFSNIYIRPNYLDISSDKNYVYANAVYAKPESEISVKVKIGGQVNLAALQMYIDYDKNLLEYVEAKNLDTGVMINKEDENPRIRLAFLSDDNVTGSVDFVELVFRVKGQSGDKAVIMYNIEKAAMINSNNDIVTADYTVKDTVIHIY